MIEAKKKSTLSTVLFLRSISKITLGKVDHPSIRYLSLEKYIRGIASFSSKGCESLAYLSLSLLLFLLL